MISDRYSATLLAPMKWSPLKDIAIVVLLGVVLALLWNLIEAERRLDAAEADRDRLYRGLGAR